MIRHCRCCLLRLRHRTTITHLLLSFSIIIAVVYRCHHHHRRYHHHIGFAAVVEMAVLDGDGEHVGYHPSRLEVDGLSSDPVALLSAHLAEAPEVCACTCVRASACAYVLTACCIAATEQIC